MVLYYINFKMNRCKSPNTISSHLVKYENGFVGPNAVEVVSSDIEKYGFIEHLLKFLGFDNEHQRYDSQTYIEYRSDNHQVPLSHNQTNLFKKVKLLILQFRYSIIFKCHY